MAKTNPIGVRFRQDVLDSLKKDNLADSPQKALVHLERFYVTWKDKAAKLDKIGMLRDEPKPDDPSPEITVSQIISKDEAEIQTLPETYLGKQRKVFLQNRIIMLKKLTID